jgi:hypothetical protein
MTSCSLTRIEGLLRVRVVGEGNGPFYRTFTVSPSISLLSWRIVKDRIRLWKAGVRDRVMELGCALHNFWVRLAPWLPMI